MTDRRRLLVTFHLDSGTGPYDVKVVEVEGKFHVLDPQAVGVLPSYDEFGDALERAARRAGWLP